jgi:mRNA-degrading endonuclease RelE of RelBE toxin-antitoxin system
MATAVMVSADFFASAYELPKEVSKKVFKAVNNFLRNPHHPGLHVEQLSGRASNLCSLRVDDDYRIIFTESPEGVPSRLFVGKHDVAYRFAGEPRVYGMPPLPDRDRDFMYCLIPTPQFQLPRTSVVDMGDLESLVTTRKYLPLAYRLSAATNQTLAFSFTEIEGIIGEGLPPSARNHRAGWANESRTTHVQCLSWVALDWKVDAVDMANERVTFRRK